MAVALTALVFAGLSSAQELSHPRVPHTTAPPFYVDVKVTMTNTKFILSRHGGPRGADARFILKNVSNKPHNFELGQKRSGLGLQAGFSRTVPAHSQDIMIMFMDYRGPIHYYGGLKSDRSKKGMQGNFVIGACLKGEDIDGC